MRKALSILILLIITAPSALVSSSGSADERASRLTPLDGPELPPIGFYRGILPMPAVGESLDSTYINVSSYTQFVPVWGKPSPFYNLSDDLGGWWGDTFVDGLIRGNGMFPLIHMNFYRKEGDKLVVDSPTNISDPSLNDTAWRAAYKKAAMDVLNTARPLYMSIGNEVNRWYEEHGTSDPDNGFQLFVSLYEEIYAEVKAESPETQVFCTFSREMVSEGKEADLSVLELFNSSSMDMLMFTTYPYSLPSVSEPSDLPDDYYLRAFEHIDDMRMGFSEIGWPSDPFFGGEAGQVDLIDNITSRLTRGQGLDLHMLGWSWLTDLEGGDQTGLRYRNGTDKTGLEAWKMNDPPSYNKTGRQITLVEDFGASTMDLSTVFFDPDPWDVLTFTVWNGTHWTDEMTTNVEISINGSIMGLSSIDNMTGSRMFQVRAEDWQADSNITFMQVTITDVNDPPAYLGDDEPYVFLEDHAINLDLLPVVEDVDDLPSSLVIEVMESPYLKVSSSYLIMTIGTLEYDWYGTTYIRYRILDPSGEFFEVNKTVEVISVNDPPVIQMPPSLKIQEDQQYFLDLAGRGSDVEDDPLEWGHYIPDEDNLSVVRNGTGLTVKPAQDWSGQTLLTLTLSDGTDRTNHTLIVDVEAVNDPPSFDRPDTIFIEEDGVGFFELDSLFPRDPDGDRLYWEVDEHSTLIQTSTIMEGDVLRVQPAPNEHGDGHVNLSLFDQHGARAEGTFHVTVIPVNDPPLFIAGDDWSLDMEWGSSKEFDLGKAPFVLKDIDTPTGSLFAVTGSEYCEVSGLVVNLTLPPGQVDAEIKISFSIHDGQGGVSESEILTVRIRGARVVKAINLTMIDLVDHEGSFKLQARGGYGQTVWVVFSDGSSYLMTEVGYGVYELILRDPDWDDGQELSYYLSMSEGGPNDSIYPPGEFTYRVEPDDDKRFPGVVMILVFLVVIGAAVILFATFKKGSADELGYDGGYHEE